METSSWRCHSDNGITLQVNSDISLRLAITVKSGTLSTTITERMISAEQTISYRISRISARTQASVGLWDTDGFSLPAIRRTTSSLLFTRVPTPARMFLGRRRTDQGLPVH